MGKFKRGIFRGVVTFITLAAFCFASFSASANPMPPISMAKMYSYASRGNATALRQAIDRGLDIDIQDRYGNTGMCHAILKRDYTAYNSFRAAGANARHPCTQRISPKLYYNFMNSGKVVPIDYVPVQAYDDSFYLTPFEWTLVGIAAGGLLWLLLSGGGSGGKYVEFPEPTYDSLGEAAGSRTPQKPIDYQASVHKYVNGDLLAPNSTVIIEQDFTLENNSIVNIKKEDIVDEDVTRDSLTNLINMNESALKYTDYIEVAIKAINAGKAQFGVSSGSPADNSEIKLGNASAGMVSLDKSTVVNYDQITIEAQNGSFGMIASQSSDAVNSGVIDIKMVPGKGDSANVNNQVNGMYVDTKSTAENKGDINGIINIDGTLVGMQARILKEEKNPNPADSSKLINTGVIKLGATANNTELNASVIGMGGFYEQTFLNGENRYKRAGYMEIGRAHV